MGYRLGVDIGTTFTAAAVCEDGSPSVLGLGNRAMQIPSVVYLESDGRFIVGESADRRAMADPSRAAREFKRRMGDHVPLLIGGSPISPQLLTAHLLRFVVSMANERLGAPPEEITVTHPANWGGYRLELMQQAIRLADVQTARLCPEPTAAAVQYAAQSRVPIGAKIAVYDLGGGTFDVSVLEKRADDLVILGTPEGIEQLGGIDFDQALYSRVLSEISDLAADLDLEDPATVTALVRLKRECWEAKESLSSDIDAVVNVYLPGHPPNTVRVTRAEFEDLIRPSLHETIAAMQRALHSADVSDTELHAIVLAGGSSRIPLVSQLLREAFDVPIALDTHPKHDIALGAVLRSPDDHAPTTFDSPEPAIERIETPTSATPAVDRPAEPDAPGAHPRLSDGDRAPVSDARFTDARTASEPITAARPGPRRPRLPLLLVAAGVIVALIVGGLLFATRPWARDVPASGASSATGSGGGSSAGGSATWRAVADLPVAVDGAAVAAFGGKVWVAGGLRDDPASTKTDRVFVYDPDRNTWSDGPSLPQRLSHAALVATDTQLLLIGGYIDSGGSNQTLALNDTQTGWTQLAPLPQTRVAGAAAWDGRRVVFAGGTRSDNTAANEVYAFTDGVWSQIGVLQKARAKLTALSNGQGAVYFLGGYDKDTVTRFTTVDQVLEGKVQRSSPALPTAIDSATSVFVPGAGLCVLGGQKNDGYNQWTCENQNVAEKLPPLQPDRAGLGSAVIGKTLFVVGGYNDDFKGMSRVESLTLTGVTSGDN